VAARYPEPGTLAALIRSAGFEPVEVTEEEFLYPCESARAIMEDGALRVVGLPEWRWIAGFDPGSEGLLHRVRDTLDTYFGGGPLTLRVRAGLVVAKAAPA
jgi:hypothetical protein